MLNAACMQKIKIGHRAKFRDKDKCFLQLLFPVRAILRCISTSGVVRARLLIEILTNFAHAHILVMAWMGYVRARLKTLSSLLKPQSDLFNQKLPPSRMVPHFVLFYFILFALSQRNCERVATTAGGHLLWTLGQPPNP